MVPLTLIFETQAEHSVDKDPKQSEHIELQFKQSTPLLYCPDGQFHKQELTMFEGNTQFTEVEYPELSAAPLIPV